MFIRNENGWIEVICGSMFSGKSEELIRRVRQATFGKISVLVFKPAIDSRDQPEEIASHNGTKTVAIPIKHSTEITGHVRKETDIVAIDEVQFFDDEIVSVVAELASDDKRVILAGLDTNFRGEPFGQMPNLMALSESVTKLNAICPVCGSPASRTQRLIDGKPAFYHDPLILIGASESYEPRCRHHHEVPGKPTEEENHKIVNNA